MERIHHLDDDLHWVPSWLRSTQRRTTWAVRGGLFSLYAGLAGASVWLLDNPGLMAAWASSLGYLSATAHGRVVRRRVRSRLARRAAGVPLEWLGRSADDVLVRVEGTVRGEGTVYQRSLIEWEGARVVHELGVDFMLQAQSEAGTPEAVRVASDEAQLVGPEPRRMEVTSGRAVTYFRECFGRSADPAIRKMARRKLSRWRPAPKVGTVSLSGGQRVEVLGFKTREPDPSIQSAGHREPPMRTVLYGTAEMPLLLVPVRERKRARGGPDD